MVISVEKIKSKKRNYFITTEEAKILYKRSRDWGLKWQVLIGLCLFRGLRIGEAIAINLKDFQDHNFRKLKVILEKSHVVDEFPIIKGFDKVLKEYIKKNIHNLRDGWLFPAQDVRCKKPHMTSGSAVQKLWKMRKVIGKDHPSFLDKMEFPNSSNKNADTYVRHRIGFHSLRRWFETHVWDKHKDKMMLRDIMRYKDSRTVDVYINPYEVWKNEKSLLDDAFGDLFGDFNNFCKGQTSLTSFVD